MVLGMNLAHSKDGILYNIDDQVKIECNDCKGCQHCCQNMNGTIILDPYDIWQLTHKLKISGGERVTFEVLISEDGPLELGSHDGMVLPHMKMVATDSADVGECPFLNNGRCSIHFCRPGFCRLFPLGRVYTKNEDRTEVGYIVLDDEIGCKIQETDYIAVKDWIGIDDERYPDFLSKWHCLKKYVVSMVEDGKLDVNSEEYMDIQMEVLKMFYFTPYGQDFFREFDERLKMINIV